MIQPFSVSSPTPAWRLLGPLDGRLGDQPLDPGPPSRRTVLALLVAYAGAPVEMSTLVDALWGADPPSRATNMVHQHVGALRRSTEPDLPRRAPGSWLLPAGTGYRIDTEHADLDVVRFRGLVSHARRVSEPAVRLSQLLEALALWRGSAGEGVRADLTSAPVLLTLNRELASTAIDAAELAIELGRADEVLPALQRVTATHPTDELVHAQLIRALGSSGLRSEALELYGDLRHRLAETLGIDPGPALRSAHLAVLRGSTRERAVSRALPTPAEIPPDQPGFVGRGRELEAMLDMLARTSTSPVVAVVTGAPGVGKTSLAVHFAHRATASFPDGQLYLDLRAFGPSEAAREPEEILARLLGTLDVDTAKIPDDVEARSALFRSVLAARRLLLVLDNVRDADQVRPLLPGSPGSMVVVTSRAELRGLAADGARSLPLSDLDADETREFLAARLGEHRLADQAEAVDALARLSGGLPLALAVAAARAAHFPDVSIGSIVAQLDSQDRTLDGFSDSLDPRSDVRSVFSWSYESLTDCTGRLFRLLSVHPSTPIGISAAAHLAEVDERTARASLDELGSAGLVTERLPGRYCAHELVRVYAADLLAERPAHEVVEATGRLYGYATSAALAAARALTPYRVALFDPDAAEGRLADSATARAWFESEVDFLIDLVRRGQGRPEYDAYMWRIAWSLSCFMSVAGRWEEQLLTQSIALFAARRSGRLLTQAMLLTGLGTPLARMGRRHEANDLFDEALRLIERHERDDTESADPGEVQVLRGETHRAKSWSYEQLGILDAALAEANAALQAYPQGERSPFRAASLNAVGYYETLLGRHRVALEHCTEALDLLAHCSDAPETRSEVLAGLGRIYAALGRLDESIDCYSGSVRLLREMGHKYSYGHVCASLAEVMSDSGDREGARALFEQARDVFDELGHERADEMRRHIDKLDTPSAAPSPIG